MSTLKTIGSALLAVLLISVQSAASTGNAHHEAVAGGDMLALKTTLEQQAPVGDVLGMIRETIGVIKRLHHTATAPDKIKLGEMIKEIDEMNVTLKESDERHDEIVADVTVMLRETMENIKGVVHAQTPEQKQRMNRMIARLDAMMIEQNIIVLKSGGGGSEKVLQDMMGMTRDIMDVMVKMKHTVPTGSEQARLTQMANRTDDIIMRYNQLTK